eukprot:TRINITY_DN95031_c0_g1_i1.p1 TRINITY_DN95031_c0_g1~~TRINITY_DN95031_c0_g1_i1.p1  ORF type:complete len:487 (+),score=12.11 TRINITY_DN95031_c0_g1_i1:10-1470(+)
MFRITKFNSIKHFNKIPLYKSFCNAAPAVEIIQNNNIDNIKTSVLSHAMKPKEVVESLDKFIVGQNDAKRAVAIALRNRWRRQQLDDNLKNEVIPKNILMIGPTGCGKTEIARRIAKLSQAPFVKVEATKYTEVGFHGKDVDQIIRDLVEISINMTRKRIKEELKSKVASIVEERLLEALVGVNADETQKQSFRDMLRDGSLDDRIIDVEVHVSGNKAGGRGDNNVIIDGNTNPGIAVGEIFKMVRGGGNGKRTEKKKLSIAEARPVITESESDKLLEEYDVIKEAIHVAEESGIVFIDEIDKLVNSGEYRGADASSEGVQRDLLPIIEGSTISTKHGNVNTDYMLFICSGAFHSSKPSDLLAELQGRLPIRVNLKGLTEADLLRILTEPESSLIKQQIELLKTEAVDLVFTDEALSELARVAAEVNRTVENIGARRLYSVIERIVEIISFDAPEKAGEKFIIDEEYVKSRTSELLIGGDMRKYIL